MDFARKVQPWLSDLQLQELADALNGAQEAQHCNVSARSLTGTSVPLPPSFPTSTHTSTTYYVDANKGSDSNSGKMDSPFQTISKAVMAARAGGSGGAVIMLRAGTFYLTETIMLSDKDSGLTIQNYPQEEVVVSGGKLITPSWQEFNTDNNMNIYKADLSSAGLDSVMGLRINGSRAIRARYPNANPETDGFGSSLRARKWLPPSRPTTPDSEENPDTPFRNTSDSFQKFQLGINGTCANFDPPGGYWCGSQTSGGGAFTYRVPSGMIADKSILPNQPYKNATGAVVQAWRPAHWASWMFEVGEYDASSSTFNFSKGGFQGARGNDNGGEFFIENVMEELDAPSEWYYDQTTKMLYLFYNDTSKTPPPAGTTFVVPVLKTLLSVQATQQNPAKGSPLGGSNLETVSTLIWTPMACPLVGTGGCRKWVPSISREPWTR